MTPNSPDSNPQPAQPSGLPEHFFSIKVIGVGGAGCNAVAHVARDASLKVSCAALNTDAAALTRTAVEHRMVMGTKVTRGLGSGGDPERGRASAEEDVEQIQALCRDAKVVFVVAGLGGGTGTGGGPVVARIAKECGALVLGIVILPFECEGYRRKIQAVEGLDEFKKAADGVICLPNERVLQLVDEKTSLIEAFAITNEYVVQGVRGISRLLTQPGLINVDFADLCAVTQGRHTEGVLVSAEARGENRVRDVIEKILAHPLMEKGHALSDTAGLLVSIAGGPDLTMTEVTRIMDQLKRHCEQALIIMGASIEEAMGDRVNVTLVAGRRPPGASQAQAEEEELQLPAIGRREICPSADRRASHAPPASAPSLTASDRPMTLPAPESNGTGHKPRKKASRWRQEQLPLEMVHRGRFEKSEPTIHQGQDLDVPTYIRRGVALN